MRTRSIAVVLALVSLTLVAAAQSKTEIGDTVPTQKIAAEHEASLDTRSSDPRDRQAQELVARTILERQLALRRDTERLLALATELKQNVDRTNTNVLSMEVVKKAKEIEKLAKSVKDKMSNAW